MSNLTSFKNIWAPAIITVLLGMNSLSVADTTTLVDNQTSAEHALPLPLYVDTILEESICMRKSLRIFSEEPVTDEDLSTVLWAAYGMRADGTRTVAEIDGAHAAVIYILKEDAVYKYNPLNHALSLHKKGDFRIIGEDSIIYKAPIQLGLCWDNAKADYLQTAAEMGAIGQNVALMAAALNLGTVVTAQFPPAMEQLELPQNEIEIVMMPLGHPQNPYDFTYEPNRGSFTADIDYSDMSLSTAIQQRNETSVLGGKLSRQEKSQILWSSYGFSSLIDNQQALIPLPRHRTVPSPHYTYDAIHMYAVTESGIYRYTESCNFETSELPVAVSLEKVVDGDKRSHIAQACSQSAIASAPLSILSVLDFEKSSFSEYAWSLWYFVAGASAHNILLEATALNLTADIVYPVDNSAILSVLQLNDNFRPLLVVPVGSHNGSIEYDCPVRFALRSHPEARDLGILKNFRDQVLSKTWGGRELIKMYYAYSNTIVNAMAENETFKQGVKEIIIKILPRIKTDIIRTRVPYKNKM